MTVRPGRRMQHACLVFLGISILCFFSPAALWLLPFLLLGCFVVAVQDYRQLRIIADKVVVARKVPPNVGQNLTFESMLTVTAGASPIHAEIRDLLPEPTNPRALLASFDLPALGQTTMSSSLRISKRGRFEFGPIWLRLKGSRGMLEVHRKMDVRSVVKVYPHSALPADTLSDQDLAEAQLVERVSQSSFKGEGLEFNSLDNFREGDDPRRIDWRSTARHRTPIVRRYHLEQHRDVVMLLDCGRLMGTAVDTGTKLDSAVDSALRLGRVALKRGDRCGLALFDDHVLGYLPPQAGANAYKVLLEHLYDAQSRMHESSFMEIFATLQSRQQKRALLIVFSDFLDAENSQQFRAGLLALARRHVVLFVALRTPALARVQHAPLKTDGDMFRNAVVMRLLREREHALQLLARAGVHVLDVEPRNLTIPLINRYVELREQGLV